MKIAKSIDDIYEEVKGFDKVITNDAPLATALNARIDVPKIDGFAYTPRQIASKISGRKLDRPAMDDIEVVKTIMGETGFDFRYVHSTLKNIRDIRKYTCEVEDYLYSKKEKEVYKCYIGLPTRDRVMAEYMPGNADDFYFGKKIAVIGLDLMDDLDKHFLPMDFEEIDLFESEGFSLERIYAIGNDRQIADNIVNLIGRERCMDTAIVLDSKSPLADAVRAALYRNSIPFKNSMSVKDLTQIRDFIQFLTLALDYRTLRVRDVRELFSAYGMGVVGGLTTSMDEYLVSKAPDVHDRRAMDLSEIMADIRNMTFRQAVDAVHDYEGNRSIQRQKAAVAILIEDLELTDQPICEETVTFLNYAVNNVDDLRHNEQIPDDERAGVLLADCKNSVYVDRPFVIFLGLDQSWDSNAAGRDYVDPFDLEENNAKRMAILLQQGSFRLYAVKPVTHGKPTAPAITFNAINRMSGISKDISRFEDLGEIIEGFWYTSAEAVMPERGSINMESAVDGWKFSKTEYNAYVDCPLKFLFHRVLPSADSDSIVFGNVLHDFAELYFCYPELVNEKGVDHFIESMGEAYSGISNECHKELDISRIRVFMRNLIRYLDTVRPTEVPLDVEECKRRHRNPMFEAEGLTMCSSWAESELNSSHHLFAKYDLRIGNTLIDYKTGKAKSPDDIVKMISWEGKKNADFQCLIYLQALLENGGTLPCSFNLFYIGDNDVASINDDFDVNQNLRHVILSDRRKIDIILDDIIPNDIRGKSTYEKIYNDWDNVADELRELNSWEPDNSDAQWILVHRLGKDGKGHRKTAQTLLKKIVTALGTEANILDDYTVILSKEVLEKFLVRFENDYVKADGEKSGPFYVLGRGKIPCSRCEYRNACMKEKIGTEESSDESSEGVSE